jgi:DNA polymerase-3 subunit epsilon
MRNDRDLSIRWAREILSHPSDVLILDTETTGLDFGSEIIQIAAIDATGQTLFNTLIKPLHPIPIQASNINGITDGMVVNAQPWTTFYPWMVELVVYGRYQKRLTFNAAFDTKMIRSSCHANSIPHMNMGFWDCAMLRYAGWWGEWNEYRQDYKWQPLTGGDHTALGDCLATLALIKRMAESGLSTERS